MSTQLRYTVAINRAVDWINANLAGDTSLPTLARVAGFSSFHFHRVFAEATGETIHAFVTRLRFERAVALLRGAPRKSLTSIAVESGFGTSSSLARAFAKQYAVKPSDLRSPSAMQALLEKMRAESPSSKPESHVLSTVQPDNERWRQHLRIERWPELPLAYVRVYGAYLKPAALIAAYRAIEDWADAQAISREQSRLIGISIDDPSAVPLAKCRYDFCRETTIKPAARSGVQHNTLAACTWAILPCSGDLTTVDQCWIYFFRQWLPASGWQPAALPALEIFHRRPEEIGWDRFELECCLPLEKMTC